jgi:hypothetical protein
MHQNTDWEKDFDAWYSKADISANTVELKDFIRSLLQAREEWLKGEIEQMPTREIDVLHDEPSVTMISKSRVLSLINKK